MPWNYVTALAVLGMVLMVPRGKVAKDGNSGLSWLTSLGMGWSQEHRKEMHVVS